jgi:GTP cyclohydrolase I
MEKDITLPQVTPCERAADNEARRLMEHIETALEMVGVRSPDDVDSLETTADRIESAARDLVGALRELARERSSPEEI